MRSQNQTILVTLAVVFAVALALAVSLICLTSAGSVLSDSDEITATVPTPTAEITVQAKPGTAAPAEKNSLLFESLGNGVCRVAGIGGCTDACVTIPERSPGGETVVSVAARAFFGCADIVAVQIPATVTEIGALAFADCPNLVYISVSPLNPAFRDQSGVLCSADGTRLILYPPMRASASLDLSASVVSIDEMAFYRCAFLSSINYAGSAEQWEQIRIGAKNYSLTAASKKFLGDERP